MGGESSKNRKYRDEDGQEESQFTEAQVGQLLEHQKLFYEQKMGKMKIEQQNQWPQPVVISSSTHVNAQMSGPPVYQRGPYVAASSSMQTSPQTYDSSVYPRLQSVAMGSSVQTNPPTYNAPVYPSLPVGTHLPSNSSTVATPMPVYISSPSAPPFDSVALDRPRAEHIRNNIQQRATLEIPAQVVLTAKSAVPPRPLLQPQTSKQSRPRTPNSSDYLLVNSRGEIERSQSPATQARDRSATRSRQKKNQEDDEIKCPTCKRTYGLTIFNCKNGHSSCNDCRLNGRACGICYQTITTTRNITLEAYIAERKAQCPYSEEGCCLYIRVADMESHVKECPFGEMSCPVDSIVGQCTWKGKLSEVSAHFDAFHPTQCQGNVDTEMFLKVTSENLSSMNTTHIARLVVIGSFHFIFHLRVSQADQKLYATVGMLGTACSASKWTYEVHIYNKRQPRRKYQHTDVCCSANTKLDDIFKESKCAAIPVSYASSFVNENKLTFKYYIKKDFNEKPFKNNRGRGRGAHRK